MHDGDLAGEPGYRFWRVERSDFCLTFSLTSASVWRRLETDPDEICPDDLDQLYAEHWFDLVGEAGLEDVVVDDIPFSQSGQAWPKAGDGPNDWGIEIDPVLDLVRTALELGQG